VTEEEERALAELKRKLEQLDAADVRILEFLALGWNRARIGKWFKRSESWTKYQVRRISDALGVHGRGALALTYVDFILPRDTAGEPDEENPGEETPYPEPGMKHEQWLKEARSFQAFMHTWGKLKAPRHLELLRLLSDPHYIDLDDVALGKEFVPPIGGHTVGHYVDDVKRGVMNAGKIKLGVIARLVSLGDADEADPTTSPL
jgi:hypothetical protein